jgi:cytidylate kinase
MKKITIAIDGFSSCGKSTMAKELAKKVGYIYIDSGAMYRVVTLYALRNGLFTDGGIDEEGLKAKIEDIAISFKLDTETQRPLTCMNGEVVEDED